MGAFLSAVFNNPAASVSNSRARRRKRPCARDPERLANKQDRDGALAEADIIEYLALEKLVNENKCLCQIEPCSAVLGYRKKFDKSIRKGLSWLLNNVANDFEALSERVQKDTAEQKAQEDQEKRERAERVRQAREEREQGEQEEAEREGRSIQKEDPEAGTMVNPFQPISNVITQNEEKMKGDKETKNLQSESKSGAIPLQPTRDAEDVETGSNPGSELSNSGMVHNYTTALNQQLQQEQGEEGEESERQTPDSVDSAKKKSNKSKLRLKRKHRVEPASTDDAVPESPTPPPPPGWQYAVMMNRFSLSVEMMQSLKCQGYSSLLKDAPGSSHSSLQCFVSETQSRLPSQQHQPGKLKQYYLLNAASLLPVLALEARDGDTILDLCSAPGGKSIAILQTVTPGILHCNEWDILRWKWLKQTLESFLPTDLYSAVMVSNLDGRHIGESEPGMYDKVLVDAPCSNDRSWLFSSDDVQAGTRIEQRDKLPALQKQLLRSAVEALRPGGTVVYSTCTLSRAENSDVIASVLSSFDNVKLVDLTGQMASMSQHFTFAPGNMLGHLVIPERGKTWGPIFMATGDFHRETGDLLCACELTVCRIVHKVCWWIWTRESQKEIQEVKTTYEKDIKSIKKDLELKYQDIITENRRAVAHLELELEKEHSRVQGYRDALISQSRRLLEERKLLQQEREKIEKEKRQLLHSGAAAALYRSILEKESDWQNKATFVLKQFEEALVERQSAFCSILVPRDRRLEMEKNLLIKAATDPVALELKMEADLKNIFKHDRYCADLLNTDKRKNGRLMWLFLKQWELQVELQKFKRAEKSLLEAQSN
ncbi:Coiled-coil domain-containing protein 127 [Acipenser ruthenus]|uniref:Coiled-coil domain-containing protein 127 n=1 Tax=Acipenser ruthenus TaxID=7906 RepID=A0A662YMJ3_ACIRT|nr:Coiled-coil domain-containing protein 127 [Acipenser ruthenus]